MRMNNQELVKRFSDYMEKTHKDIFWRTYETKEESYEDYGRIFKHKPLNLALELAEELDVFINDEDLSNPSTKDLYYECVNLAFDINVYANNLNKDKEL